MGMMHPARVMDALSNQETIILVDQTSSANVNKMIQSSGCNSYGTRLPKIPKILAYQIDI